ncbi:GDP-mannose mannosyl hydrolase [Shewanella violacea]|uniref:GDP-mannose mannosyl hydrolase n=1 Tax=Shewanella violacea (strain JCM 10179 / CIP 106290 / LMG 19151 / DSS12) TaxID=637905 RepID=D4ZIE0_SHEVD|nr:GDP-mannose mannosyl hydrolase [Shewanella violacea]BAJ01439.1 GDP-mannose mannosyl hydrolase [Shewanella violacea DSS12]
MLPLELFKTIVSSTPLVSIDFMVMNDCEQILLGKRINRPAKDYWFVPGGRVLKDESIEEAFIRLLDIELGLTDTVVNFKGVYQHFYEDSFSGDDSTTHYVVLAYKIRYSGVISTLPNEQHADYKWFNLGELLKHERVHIHTKWYFQEHKQAIELQNKFNKLES